jgi:hypothetical protein
VLVPAVWSVVWPVVWAGVWTVVNPTAPTTATANIVINARATTVIVQIPSSGSGFVSVGHLAIGAGNVQLVHERPRV